MLHGFDEVRGMGVHGQKKIRLQKGCILCSCMHETAVKRYNNVERKDKTRFSAPPGYAANLRTYRGGV